MMGWILIFVRTFPFWALPFGLALIAGWWTSNRIKSRRGRSFIWPLAGVTLILASAAFFFYQGHFKAVPFVWEMIRGPASDP